MIYLPLNVRRLPAAPTPASVFLFLQEEEITGAATFHQYRVALLVADANQHLINLLSRSGFVASDDDTPLNGWTYFVATDASPLRPLSDNPAAPAAERLETYLSFSFPDDGGDDGDVSESWPSDIQIASGAVAPALFRRDANFGMAAIHWRLVDGTPQDWQWTWGPDASDDVLPELILPLSFPAPDSSRSLTYFLRLTSRPNGAPADPWRGGSFFLNDVELSGPEATPIVLGEYTLTGGSSVRFTAAPAAIEFPVGPRAQLRASGEQSDLVVRIDDSGAGAYFDPAMADDRIVLEALFPLIMAGTSQPGALAVSIPLLSVAQADEVPLNWTLRMCPTSPFTAPVLTFDDDRWNLNSQLWVSAEEQQWDFTCQWADEGTLDIGGIDWSMRDLVGSALNAQFAILPFRQAVDEFAARRLEETPCRVQNGVFYAPVLLKMGLGDQSFECCLDIAITPTTFRLAVNRLYFRLPPASYCNGPQVLDLIAFAIILPQRTTSQYFAASSNDGYFDFADRELVIFGATDQAAPKPVLAIPGNLASDLSQRVLFEFQPFHPETWPQLPASQRPIFLRINGEGLSLYAKVMTQHLPNVLKGSDKRRPLGMTPQQERNGKTSEVLIIDNRVVRAVVFCELEVPGVDDLLAKVEIGMSQDKRGKPPTIHAEVDLDTSSGKPIADLSAGFLKLQIDDMRARLEWNLDTDEWDMSVPVDASLMFSDAINNSGGLDDLADPDVIKVTDLDLLHIHEGFGSISLPLSDSVSFTCLDEMFGVSLKSLSFTWGNSFTLQCEEAEFTFRNPGTFDVAIEVGGVHIEFFPGGRVKMRNPSRIGIDATIGDSVRFRGAVAWVDNDRENYFAAAGTLAIEGLPEAKTLLSLGSGRKLNGQIVPNIAFYGSLDYEFQLFSGVVAKNFGAGIGINNRLAGIDDRPNAEKLLQRIDDLDPSRIANWQFVERNGFYLSIVGTTIIASNTGGNDVTNAYVASILLSVDVDLNIVAAAKVWLASSVNYVRKKSNWTRPALVGAVAILPRERLFTAAIESRKSPAIESSDQLSKIFDHGKVAMAFVLSPDLVDFHLKEVSYEDNFLGVDMAYRGSFRLAFFRSTLLVRAKQTITGNFEKRMEAGPGGFSCHGELLVNADFGGLLSGRGLAIYGMIGLQAMLDVNAWITIGFSFTIGWGRWKKRISFEKTFRLPATRLEIGLHGAAAFDESGAFGFSGSLSISVSICGYWLSISPAFAVNDGVIEDVRRRVSVFEEKLEAYRDKLLTGGTRAPAFALAAAVEQPRWLHYQVGQWHLLVPRARERWLTPRVDENRLREGDADSGIPFEGHVDSIELSYDDSQGTHVLQLQMPWAREHWDASVLTPSQLAGLEEIELTMAETTAAAGIADGAKTAANHYVVSDPRVESSDREYWTELDQAMLPSYALPIRMKSADQILQSGEAPQDFTSKYGRLVEYLYWFERATDERRHRGDDPTELEELEQRRAVVLHELLSVMETAADPNATFDSPWIAQPVNTQDVDAQLFRGLIFRLEEGATLQDDTLRINRRQGTDTLVESPRLDHAAERVAAARRSVQLLPPRQAFVIDKERDSEGGRIQVRLPIKLNDKDAPTSQFLDEELPVFSHFEVHRRIRGEGKAVLVASRQYPSIARLDRKVDDKPVVVVDPYIFTDEFPVQSRGGDRSISTPGVEADQTVIEYAIRMVPIGHDPDESALSPWQAVKLHLPQADRFPVDVSMVLPTSAVYRPANGDTSLWTTFQLLSVEGSPTLALTEIWHQVKSGAHKPNFEIWAEERVIEDSGFYAGSEHRSPASPRRSGDGRLSQVSADAEFISTEDKFWVPVEPAETPGAWRLVPGTPAQQRMRLSGYGYRFYIRPLYGAEMVPGPLRPLGASVARELPEVKESSDVPDTSELYAWTETPRLRFVGQVEWIDTEEKTAIEQLCRHTSETPSSQVVPVSLAVRGLETEYEHERLRRTIGVGWRHSMHRANANFSSERLLPAGGVELRIRDRDDSAIEATLICETRDQANYQQTFADFSNDSAWRLTRRERARRVHGEPLPALSPVLGSPQTHWIHQSLHVDRANPAVSGLLVSAQALRDAIASSSWPVAAAAASKWIETLDVFERSPLNLNDSQLRDAISRVVTLLRYLFLGRDPSVRTQIELTPEKARQLDDALDDQLQLVAELKPQASDFADDEELAARRAFLESTYAKKLAAIIRRRRLIAEDVLSARGKDTPLAMSPEDAASDGWLPRSEAFERIRQLHDQWTLELGGPLTELNKLLQWFPRPVANQPPAWVDTLLLPALAKLESLVEFGMDTSAPDIERMAEAAAVAAKATGLTLCLKRLERQFDLQGSRLERRPHHRVIVTEAADGKKTPERVRLSALLPDADRSLSEVGSAPPGDGAAAAGIIAYFNLLERMGFAVDIAAVDRLGQPLRQPDLVSAVRKAQLEAMLAEPSQLDHLPLDAHVVYLLTPREPDSEHRGELPDPGPDEPGEPYAYTGMAFAKLAVVPLSFHTWLVNRNQHDRDVALTNWLAGRGIDVDDDKHLEVFARAAQHVGLLANRPDSEGEPAKTGALMQVRLAPLELRHVTVPHADGTSHVDFAVPDRRGHRYEVSARSMSRYEPFVRWAEGLPRAVCRHPGQTCEVRRILTYADGVDLPIPQPVSVFLHPEKLQFSYTLPSAGLRSILNRISAVRTGYKGCRLRFRYELIDHDSTERKWAKVLSGMVRDDQPVEEPPPVVVATPRLSQSDVRLFRNQRLVTLEQVPYFYGVTLHVHGQYDGDVFVDEQQRNLLRREAEQYAISPGRRLPAVIAYRRPRVERTGNRFSVEIVLTRHAEMAAPGELKGGMPHQKFSVGLGNDISLAGDMLPDLSLGYHFYHLDGDMDAPASRRVYKSVVELLMPWNEGYLDQAGAQSARPMVRAFNSKVRVLQPYPAIQLRPTAQIDGETMRALVVTMEFEIQDPGLFFEPERQFMQVSCRGKLTPATVAKEVI